jgi:hypothetical protein
MTDKDDEAAIKAAQKLARQRIKEQENVADRDQRGKAVADEAAKRRGKPKD